MVGHRFIVFLFTSTRSGGAQGVGGVGPHPLRLGVWGTSGSFFGVSWTGYYLSCHTLAAPSFCEQPRLCINCRNYNVQVIKTFSMREGWWYIGIKGGGGVKSKGTRIVIEKEK